MCMLTMSAFLFGACTGDSPFRNGTRIINSRAGQNIQPFKKIQIGMGRNVNQAKRKTGNKKKK